MIALITALSDALEMLFSRTNRWTDLISVIERRIEQTADPERRETLYGQMASIYDQQLGRPDDAVASYKRVLEPAQFRGLPLLYFCSRPRRSTILR